VFLLRTERLKSQGVLAAKKEVVGAAGGSHSLADDGSAWSILGLGSLRWRFVSAFCEHRSTTMTSDAQADLNVQHISSRTD
jgi:hypothetical protein